MLHLLRAQFHHGAECHHSDGSCYHKWTGGSDWHQWRAEGKDWTRTVRPVWVVIRSWASPISVISSWCKRNAVVQQHHCSSCSNLNTYSSPQFLCRNPPLPTDSGVTSTVNSSSAAKSHMPLTVVHLQLLFPKAQSMLHWESVCQNASKILGMGIEPTTSAVLRPRHNQLDHPSSERWEIALYIINNKNCKDIGAHHCLSKNRLMSSGADFN